MPMYVFEDSAGVTREEYFPVTHVPSIGDEIVREGRAWMRVFCGHAGMKRTNTKALGYPFASESLPRDVELGCRRDKKGRQVIASKRQEKQVLSNMEGVNGLKWVRD